MANAVPNDSGRTTDLPHEELYPRTGNHEHDTDVRLAPAFDVDNHILESKKNLMFGMPPLADRQYLVPDFTTDEFRYSPSEVHARDTSWLPLLLAPPAPEPPLGQHYPLAPAGGYTLVEDSRYLRGYAYISPYNLWHNTAHRERLLVVATPPEVFAKLVDGVYQAQPLPGMVQLVPGVPFAVRLNSDDSRLQTVACLQTMDSLRVYSDYDEICAASLKLAKLSWGCTNSDGTVVPPIYTLPGLKRNKRSAARKDFHHNQYDGSYSLANTVMEGEGQGSVLPAVQANTPAASSHTRTVLETLHRLRTLILPKCISKFELQITDFQAEYCNIFSFGGLSPSGTSVQLNVSSLGEDLAKAIGELQGYWHTDFKDDKLRFSLVTILLRVGPDGDPGPFCLGRWGLYSREHGAWIIFLVFKGVDLHSGFAPSETPEAHKAFLDGSLEAAYNMSDPANRLVYVSYNGFLQADRSLGSLNASPPTGFGNYTPALHKQDHLNFATHGLATLGSQEAYANRMGREFVYNLWNSLSHCNLTLDLDLDDLMKQITFKAPTSGVTHHLLALPYNPTKDAQRIQRYLGMYNWHEQQCNELYIRITKEDLKRQWAWLAENTARLRHSREIAAQNNEAGHDRQADSTSGGLDVLEVISHTVSNKRAMFMLKIRGEDMLQQVAADCPQLVGNPVIIQFLMSRGSIRPGYIATSAVGSAAADILPCSREPLDVSQRSPPSSFSVDEPSGLSLTEHGDAPARAVSESSENTLVPTEQPETVTSSPEHPACGEKRSASQAQLSDGSQTQEDALMAPVQSRVTKKAKLVPELKTKDPAAEAPPVSKKKPTKKKTNKKKADDGTKKTRSKTKAACESSSQAASRGESVTAENAENTEDAENTEPVYDVERIEAHRFNDEEKQVEFLTKWSGYEELTWEPSAQLGNCIELLAEYAAKHMLILGEIQNSTGLSSSKSTGIAAPLALADSFMALDALLDESQLALEIFEVQCSYDNHKARAKDWKSKNISLVNLISDLDDLSSGNSDLEAYVSILGGEESIVADLVRLDIMQRTTRRLPALIHTEWILSMLNRSVLQEICNAWVMIYEWSVSTSDRLTESLMRLHRNEGYRILNVKYPLVANLVDHVVRYVAHTVKKALEEITPEKTTPKIEGFRKDVDHILSQCSTESASPPGPKVPADMYGLLASLAKGFTCVQGNRGLDSFPGKRTFDCKKHKVVEFVYSEGTRLLGDLWTYNVILPTLREIEKITNMSAHKGSKDQNILDCALVRGAILSNIQEMCGGPAIFTSSRVKAFLANATKMFKEAHHREERFAAALRKDRQAHLAPLVAALRAIMQERPGIAEKAEILESLVHRTLNGLKRGSPFEDGDESDPVVRKAAARPRRKKGDSLLLLSNIPIKDLLPNPQIANPRLGSLGLIVREALSHKRNLRTVAPVLRRILLGQPLFQSSASKHKNPDWTNPMRLSSHQAQLFSANLPPTSLTTKSGISSLLSFMGTGQGWGTRGFLASLTNPTKFAQASLEDTVQMFITVGKQNSHLITSMQHPEKHHNFMHCFDMRVWGQCSAQHSISPLVGGKRQTVSMKLEPYWTAKVQDSWAAFLGDLLDHDPTTWVGKRPSWTEMHDFILSLDVSPFKSGLTIFQTTNNLAVSRVCELPTPSEMAAWVSRQSTLGAQHGLKMLGFSVETASLVYAGFHCVWKHLDTFLSASDKVDLGFGPIIVEHILCKVPRWTNIYNDLAGLAESAENSESDAPWTLNRNLTDPRAFPIPLTISRGLIEEVLKDLS